MTALVATPDDLSWMRKACSPDAPFGALMELPAAIDLWPQTKGDSGAQADRVVLGAPYVLAMGEDLNIVHRGVLPPGIACVSPLAEQIKQWAAASFFLCDIPRDARHVTVDGLRRWCEGPDPEMVLCPRCKGRHVDPDAGEEDSDGSVLACTLCHGMGEVREERQSAEENIFPLAVDRNELRAIVNHLRGEHVAAFVRPALEDGQPRLHLRHIVGTSPAKFVEGDWRLVIAPLDETPILTH